MLLLAAVMSLSLVFLMLSSSPRIDASTLFSMLVCPLPPSLLNIYSQSPIPLGSKTLCIVINFLVLWSICLSTSPVYFQNNPEYFTRRTTHVFSLLQNYMVSSNYSSDK